MTGFVFSDKAVEAAAKAWGNILISSYEDRESVMEYRRGMVERLLAAAVAVDAHRIEQETREKIAREVESTGTFGTGQTAEFIFAVRDAFAARIRAGRAGGARDAD